ncbi:MAG: hypothetical protein IT366_15045 [Candidatus Hydrogenedentes bacterium]|nr:hypothetical protein [Candidatus Hydrogenedentota bacterium]
MDKAKILFAEDVDGVLAQAHRLLVEMGHRCIYTRDEKEFAAALAASDDIDIMFATLGMVNQALPHVRAAEAMGGKATVGYMIELPGFSQQDDPPHLRRSMLQRLCSNDTAEDICEFVRTAMPRVLLLRQTRDANRYMRLVRDALGKAQAVSKKIGGNGEGDGAMETIAETLDANAAFESMYFFIQPAASTETECRHQRCEHFLAMARALRDAIDVLRATKNHFKSKELGELRKRLETTLDSCLMIEREPAGEHDR